MTHRDQQLRLLYEASRSVQEARNVSIRLGNREHADQCFKHAYPVDTQRLHG